MTKALLFASLFFIAPVLQAQTWDGGQDDGQAAWMEQQAAATRAYHARIATAMAASRDVREQAFAEVLRRAALTQAMAPASDAPSRAVPGDAETDARLRAIAARAGDDTLANQLLVAAVAESASPLRTEAVRRWQAADPGNLAPLLHAGLPADALLVEARRATHSTTQLYDMVRWMTATLLRHPPTTAERAALSGGGEYHEEEAAAIFAMGFWFAIATPGYQPLIEACRGTALRATPTRTSDCRHLANVLWERSDGALERSIGLAMLRELSTANAERTAVDAQRRTMDWQMLQWGRIAQQQPRDGAEQFVRLLRDETIRSEQQLMERVLHEAGVPLEPPAGWSPPRR